jgi:TolB protein
MIRVWQEVAMSRAFRSALSLVALLVAAPQVVPTLLAADPPPAVAPKALPAPFESDADIGDLKIAGTTVFGPGRGEIRMTASGLNLWGPVDAFRFLSLRITGDLDLYATIAFVGEGRNPHRKAGLMVRASLAPDAPYAHAVVHGDGLVSLQYREAPGAETKEVKASLKTVPVTLLLSRRGDVFTMLASAPGTPPQQAASIRLALPALSHAGVVACSHEADWLETAVFTDVALVPRP